MASRPPPIPPRPGMLGKSPMPNAGRSLPKPPAPSLVPKIRPGSVERVDDIGGAGQSDIWIVTVTGGTKVVVKSDSQFVMPGEGLGGAHAPAGFAKPNMAAINTVMATASPTAMAEQLERSELDALGAFRDAPKNLNDAVMSARTGKKLLLKMKYDATFAATSNKGVNEGRPGNVMSDADRAASRRLFEDLRNNEPAWRTLGQVVIADYLIGNSDRIDMTDGKVQNFGNLIFSRDATGKVTHALGYDAIDPAAGSSKNLYGGDITDWINEFGQYIANKSVFRAKASGVVASLNRHRMTLLGIAPYSGSEAQWLANGLMIGWDKQANAIGAAARAGKAVPSGLMARAKYLRWVK